MNIDYEKPLPEQNFGIFKIVLTILLSLFIPIVAFIVSSTYFYKVTNISSNKILGAATQNVSGNADTSFINKPDYNVVNSVIYKNGVQIVLHGANWFGFENNDTHVVHGLWARNWKDMIAQMKSIGINAVRIPYCPSIFNSPAPSSINYTLNADLLNLNGLQIMDKILAEFNAQKMYILLDEHTPDCQNIAEKWYTDSYTEAIWINNLKLIANRYKDLDYFMGLDLKNEPHSSATWGTGNISTDWNLAAERAGKAVLSVNSNILIFIEGISNASNCSQSLYTNWGGDFEPFSCFPISSAQIPYNKLVLSPHVYGPDVASQGYLSDALFPSNLPDVMNKQFGFLKDQNFSIVPGEWGGKYGNGGLATDKTWQDAFSSYMISKSICSSFYWDWNPNSGDTGGILKDDWTTLWANKVQMLQNYFNSCKQSTSSSSNTPVPAVTTAIPVKITSIPVLTSTVSPADCLCGTNNLCSTTCNFTKSSGATYPNQISCGTESANPSQADKNLYCNRSARTIGDADGDGVVNSLDYIYYVRVVNGGSVPTSVNSDFSGDGKVSPTDRDIVIKNLAR